MSKSVWSCAGVTFTAPVPNSGSTAVVGDDRDLAAVERVAHGLARRAPGTARRRGAPRSRCRRASSRRVSSRPRSTPLPSESGYRNVTSSPVDVLVLDLGVRQAGLVGRAPVDEPLAPVDQALLRTSGRTPTRTARDSPSSIVKRSRSQSQGGAHALDLARRSRRRTAPSTPRRARRTLRGRGRGGRSPPRGARAPRRPGSRCPAWSVPGTHSVSVPCIRARRISDVLERAAERVPDVEPAGDVRRRDDDAVGLALRRARSAWK